MNELQENPTVTIAHEIVGNPGATSTANRYDKNTRMYLEILGSMSLDPNNMDTSGTRDKSNDAVAAGLQLIMQRCGPRAKGYEGLSATATGEACKSAIVYFWRSKRINTQYTESPDGSYSGNPGTSPALTNLIKKLVAHQKRAGIHIVVRAYQETHEDVRTICRAYFDRQIRGALAKDPSVNYAFLQASVVNCCQFGAVCRADELLALQIESLVFSSDAIGTAVGGVLPITKTKPTESHVVFQRAVHRSFCALEKLLVWLAILRAHGISSGFVFVSIIDNKLIHNKPLAHRSYAGVLTKICEAVGVPHLGEHSARRGGLGYQYYVLKKDLAYLFRTYSWKDLNQMMKYMGIEDEVNSYARLGYSALGTQFS